MIYFLHSFLYSDRDGEMLGIQYIGQRLPSSVNPHTEYVSGGSFRSNQRYT